MRACAPANITYSLKLAIDSLILSTKHPSFEEEGEWRIIYRPKDSPTPFDVPKKIVSVNGIVQRVHCLRMKNQPDKNLTGADLNELLDKVLIGPTPNPTLVEDAFIQLADMAGLDNPTTRVAVSAVPLRR
jgi:hypothetical protein